MRLEHPRRARSMTFTLGVMTRAAVLLTHPGPPRTAVQTWEAHRGAVSLCAIHPRVRKRHFVDRETAGLH